MLKKYQRTPDEKIWITLLRIAINAIFAGAAIGIGVLVYLNCSNKIVGAIFFTVGLLAVLSLGFCLYTGMVGNSKHIKDVPILLLAILFNAVGMLVVLIVPTDTSAVQEIVQTKLSCNLLYVFGKGVVCGILIHLCVLTFKKAPYITLFAVPTFILCGAEHSIADIGFFFAAREVSLKGFIFIIVVILGNAAGGLLMGIWDRCKLNGKQD